MNAQSNHTIERCIVTTDSGSGSNGITNNNGFQDNILVRNCRVECTSLSSNGGISLLAEATVQNNTVVMGGGGTGIERSGSDTMTFTNNVAVNGATDFDLSGTDSGSGATATYNASEDTSATGTGAVTGISLTDGVDFTEPSTGDYSVVSGGALHEAGTTIGTFSDDIAGNTRS
jgi:hypothetical protein